MGEKAAFAPPVLDNLPLSLLLRAEAFNSTLLRGLSLSLLNIFPIFIIKFIIKF